MIEINYSFLVPTESVSLRLKVELFIYNLIFGNSWITFCFFVHSRLMTI